MSTNAHITPKKGREREKLFIVNLNELNTVIWKQYRENKEEKKENEDDDDDEVLGMIIYANWECS